MLGEDLKEEGAKIVLVDASIVSEQSVTVINVPVELTGVPKLIDFSVSENEIQVTYQRLLPAGNIQVFKVIYGRFDGSEKVMF